MDSLKNLRNLDLECSGISDFTRGERGGHCAFFDFSSQALAFFKKVIDCLASVDFDDAIRANLVTFGLVKPHLLYWGNGQLSSLGSEEQALRTLLGAVKEKVDLVFAGMGLLFDGLVFSEFRRSNVERMTCLSSLLGYSSVWAEECTVLCSGFVNPMIICGESAVENWRAAIGSSRPDVGDRSTLRARFARVVTNNLLHGTDGADYNCNYLTVKYEVGVVVNYLRRLLHLNSVNYS